jgi:ElaB/YqjD/DUF883 family membrane-anchored ribosome-binding protein
MDTTSEKLIQEVRTVVHDAENLIKLTAGDIEDKTREARAKLAGALVVARETCNRLEHHAVSGMKATDHHIRENPYPSIGLAFCLGLVAGILSVRA